MSFITRAYKFGDSAPLPQEVHKKQQHAMAVNSLKKLVKPLLRLIKKRQLLRKNLTEIQQENAYNSSLEDMRKDPVAQNANEENLANEALEQRIVHEIRHCAQGAAVVVREGPRQRVVAVQRQQSFIPVHFARTPKGTFFWTSIDAAAREQELLQRTQLDRWGQA